MARILVVDDEADATEALCRFIRKHGHDAKSLPNGREALAGMATFRPDVVVLDLMMPEMDGVEFLEVLRLYYRGALMPVILLTALSGGPFVQRAMQLGVKRLFVKASYDLSDLLACINELTVSELASLPAMGTHLSR